MASPNSQKSPQAMEASTITLPAIKDWDVRIGQLYNCRSSKRVTGNIFNQEVDKSKDEFLENIPTPDMQYRLYHVKDAKGNSEYLDVSAYVKLELPGALTLEGGIDFRKESEDKSDREELICEYTVLRNTVRTRASVLDPANHSRIIHADFNFQGAGATHYVSEIRYGGRLTGKFTLRYKLSHDLLFLSGTVGGMVPIFPGVMAGLKATVSFMNKSSSSLYDKNITLQGSLLGQSISKVKADDSDAYSSENLLTQFRSLISIPKGGKGIVPISFKLSPLSVLLNLPKGIETYGLLDNQLLEALQSMLFHLFDFSTDPHHYRRLIRLEDPSLLLLFQKFSEGNKGKNPWAQMINEAETSYIKEAKEMLNSGKEMLGQYKRGVVGVKDLIRVVKKFNKSPLRPTTLKEGLLEHAVQGQKILNTLQLPDSSLAKQSRLFIFDPDEYFDELYPDANKKTGRRLILNTMGHIPNGVLLQLYSITPYLKHAALNFTVLVIAPNIPLDKDGENIISSSDVKNEATLCLRLEGVSKPIPFRGNDIKRLLTLLKVIIASHSQEHSNTSKFYSVYAEKFDKNCPQMWDIDEDLMDRFEFFKEHFHRHKLCIADDYLQMIELLHQKDKHPNEWTFLLLNQFIGSSYNVIKGFAYLTDRIKDKVSYRTIVGHFDTAGTTGDYPLMFILNSSMDIKAICMDQLDFHILGEKLLLGQDLQLLSMSSVLTIGTSLTPQKVAGAIELYNILSGGGRELFKVSKSPFEIEVEKNQEFSLALNLLRAACYDPMHKLVEMLAFKTAELFGGRVMGILSQHGWSETFGFQTDDPRWEELANKLGSFKREQETKPSSEIVYLNRLIELTKYAHDRKPERLSQICQFVMDRSNLQLKGFSLTSTAFLIPLLQSIKELTMKAHYNTNFFELHSFLDTIKNDTDSKTVITELFDKMSNESKKWSLEEVKWVWMNPKFQYWIEKYLSIKTLLVNIYKSYCTTEEGIPLWFPDMLQQRLVEIEESVGHPGIRWIKEWRSHNEMMDIFQGLLMRRNVPENFNHVLATNLRKHPSLSDTLKDKNVLFHWKHDGDGGYFDQGWTASEIQLCVNAFKSPNNSNIVNQNLQQKNIDISNIELPTTSNNTPLLVKLNEKWKPWTGGSVRKFTLHEFHSFGTTFSPLKIDSDEMELSGNKILSFFLQQMKLGHISVLQNPQGLEMDWNFPSLADWIILFLNSSDELIISHAMLALSRKSQKLRSLPWFIPDVSENSKTMDLTRYIQLVDLEVYHPYLESRLLSYSFRLITAVRFGSFKNSSIGKSSILNKSILSNCKFTSKDDIGKPLDRHGLVELSWMCEFTTRTEFFEVLKEDPNNEQQLLLANVHGDSEQLPIELFKKIESYTGLWLVFWGCESWKEMNQIRKNLEQRLGDVPMFNIVVDPSTSIRRRITNEDMILNTNDANMERKMSGIIKIILTRLRTTTLDAEREDEFTNYVRKHGIESSRVPTTTGSKMKDSFLLLFNQGLSRISSRDERNRKLNELQYFISKMNNASSKRASRKYETLIHNFSKYQKKYSREMLIALQAAKYEWRMSRLNFTRLLINSSAVGGGMGRLMEYFLDSYPMEFFNWRDGLSNCVLPLLNGLDNIGIKFWTIGVMGPYTPTAISRSIQSTLFPSNWYQHSTEEGEEGVSMRLIWLNQNLKVGPMKAILLLACEDFFRIENTNEHYFRKREKEIGALILNISDISLVAISNNNRTGMADILESSFFSHSGSNTMMGKQNSLFSSDMILVAPEPETPNSKSTSSELDILAMLRIVSNLTSRKPIETQSSSPVLDKFRFTYIRWFGEGFQIPLNSVEQLFQNVISTLKERQPQQGLSTRIIESLEGVNITTPSTLTSSLDLEDLKNDFKQCLGNAYLAHENLLEKEKHMDFSSLNTIPYLCPQVSKPVTDIRYKCECIQELKNINELELKLQIMGRSVGRIRLIQKELDDFCKQLRAEIISRVVQESHAQQLKQKESNGSLAKKLQEMIKELGPNPWSTFKLYVADSMNVGAWNDVVEQDIRDAYGTHFLEDVNNKTSKLEMTQLDVFNLSHIGIWDKSPLDMKGSSAEMKGKLSWEHCIWLEQELDKLIRKEYAGYGYKRGRVRVLKQHIDKKIGLELRQREGIPSELDYLPNFIKNIHVIALGKYLEHWNIKWNDWIADNNPLKLLEEKKGIFPNIF